MQQLRCSTIIIVPTINLQLQWKEEILRNLDITEDKIGLVGDGNHDFKPVTIAVVNSIRVEDLSKFDFMVLDETHKYASTENIKPLVKSNCKYRLGITATLEDEKYDLLKELIGEICYTYDQKDGINDGILNRFELVNVGVNLTAEEQVEYDRVDSFIKSKMREFKYDFKYIASITRDWHNPQSRLAQEIMRKISTRRMIYSNTFQKLDKAMELVERHKGDRIIVFNEYIGCAEELYKRLVDKGYRAGIYHSNEKDYSIIEQFDEGKIDILVSVKSLNEGLNVKSARVAIMVSANNVRRNTIQRLGRILRKQEGKNVSIMYQLFCRGTKEYKDMNKRTAILNEIADKVGYE